MNDLQAQIVGGMVFVSLILHLVQIRSLSRIRARLRQRAPAPRRSHNSTESGE